MFQQSHGFLDKQFSFAYKYLRKYPSQALFYDEKYQEALENLDICQKFDPSWELSKSKYESTVKFLLSVKEMVSLKGKLKPRKLNTLLKVCMVKYISPFIYYIHILYITYIIYYLSIYPSYYIHPIYRTNQLLTGFLSLVYV